MRLICFDKWKQDLNEQSENIIRIIQMFIKQITVQYLWKFSSWNSHQDVTNMVKWQFVNIHNDFDAL